MFSKAPRLSVAMRPLLLRSLKAVMTPGRMGPTTMALAPSMTSAHFSYTAAPEQRTVSSAKLKVENPELMIAFTCKKCDTRSSHTMSKQAYTSGTVLIKCPGCENRHLIADHLKIFSDDRITIEDILAAKGESASSNLDDLVFEDIPEKLKGVLGRHAKDAPEEFKDSAAEDEDFKKIPGPKE